MAHDVHSYIGLTSPAETYDIEKGAIKRFAQALGSRYAPYYDEAAAHQQGLPGIVAPPTFAITLKAPEIPGLALPAAGIIHGEQSFTYGKPYYAGDRITVQSHVSEYKVRAGMAFLTMETQAHNQKAEFVFKSTSVLILKEAL